MSDGKLDAGSQYCRLPFQHSVIAATVINFFFPIKPDFPAGGSEVQCPNWGKAAKYQRTDPLYRASVTLSAYLTDKSRWRSARLWLHLGHPTSPNKGVSSSRDMGACLLRTVACRYLSRSSRAPFVVLIATGHRAAKPVILLLKKTSWMSRLLSGDHCKIVVNTERTDVERHFHVRRGYCHGFHTTKGWFKFLNV